MSRFPHAQSHQLEYSYSDTGEKVVARFFHQVYLWMALGIALTAVVACAISQSAPLLKLVYGSNLGYVAIGLGLFAIAWFFNKAAMSLSLGMASAIYLIYCVVTGLLISGIFLVYSTNAIVVSFLMTGGVFGIMSILGFVLKIDLSKIGAITSMAVLGLFLGAIVNIVFIKSDIFSWVITYGVLAAFIVITAWKTQELKDFARQSGHDNDLAPRVALIGSLSLYIAFINIFLAMLRIFSSRGD